jgi:hypothetical protein
MGRKDAGHYSRKHGPDAVVDDVLRDELLKRVSDGELSCAVALEVAKELGVPSDTVGRAADLMELQLTKCQLGLFGYRPEKSIVKPATSVSPELEKAILTSVVNKRLPCNTAWEIARQLGIKRMKVSAACDALGIKIKPCQLGAF